MAVQDPVFNSDSGTNPAPTGVPSAAAPAGSDRGDASASAAASLTEGRVGEILDARLGPITESLRGMNDFFGILRERAAQQQAEAATGDDGDFNRQWIENPQQVLAQTFAREAQPIVALTADALGEQLLSNEESKIDEEFGPEAWQQVIRPKLDPVVAHVKATNPQQLLNKEAVRNAIRTILGHEDNRAKLNELRDKWTKDRATKDTATVDQLTEQVLSRSNLSGGIRRVDGKVEKLTPEQLGILDAFERDMGVRPDEQRLASLISLDSGTVGTTLEQWQKATAAKKAAA